MSKVEFGKLMLDFKGEPLKNQKGEVLTYKDVCQIALWESTEKDTGEDKYNAYKLSRKIDSSDEVELSTSEVDLIKIKIAKVYGTLVVGLVYDLVS